MHSIDYTVISRYQIFSSVWNSHTLCSQNKNLAHNRIRLLSWLLLFSSRLNSRFSFSFLCRTLFHYYRWKDSAHYCTCESDLRYYQYIIDVQIRPKKQNKTWQFFLNLIEKKLAYEQWDRDKSKSRRVAMLVKISGQRCHRYRRLGVARNIYIIILYLDSRRELRVRHLNWCELLEPGTKAIFQLRIIVY